MQVSLNTFKNINAIIPRSKNIERTFEIKKHDIEVDLENGKIELSRKRYTEYVQSTNDIVNGRSPRNLVDSATNSINIEKGVYYSLGTVNGKPLNGTPLTGGGINSNFSLKLYRPPGSQGTPLTAEEIYSYRVFQSQTMEERQKANQLIGVFLSLELVANGTFSTEHFNEQNASQFPQFAEGIGLNLNKPFSINGRSFEFKNGKLLNTEE